MNVFGEVAVNVLMNDGVRGLPGLLAVLVAVMARHCIAPLLDGVVDGSRQTSRSYVAINNHVRFVGVDEHLYRRVYWKRFGPVYIELPHNSLYCSTLQCIAIPYVASLMFPYHALHHPTFHASTIQAVPLIKLTLRYSTLH